MKKDRSVSPAQHFRLNQRLPMSLLPPGPFPIGARTSSSRRVVWSLSKHGMFVAFYAWHRDGVGQCAWMHADATKCLLVQVNHWHCLWLKGIGPRFGRWWTYISRTGLSNFRFDWNEALQSGCGLDIFSPVLRWWSISTFLEGPRPICIAPGVSAV